MKLSRNERWMLSNQLRILEALYPDEAKDNALMREAIESGYEITYDWFMPHIYDEENTLSESACREVLDVMAMYQAIKWSYDALDDKSGVDEQKVKFPGFSGNEETTYMAFARFLRKQNKYADLDRGDDFNSHAPMLSRYRRMLPAWKRYSESMQLSKEQIIELISA